MKTCATQGCPTLTAGSYCDPCVKAKRKASDRRRPNASRRGYNTKWRRTRRRYLSTHPICQHEAGCIAPATDVHHLDGQGPNGPHGHDDLNLQSLCHPHHSKVTSQEQAGGWAA